MNRKSAAYRIKRFAWNTKAVDEAGKFSGYASVFGVIDSYNEVVAPGAFAESLKELAAADRTLPALWQHRTEEPIGNWLELAEDQIGLLGEGQLWMEDAPYARIAHRGMKTKSITGLSIGYYERNQSYDERTRIRTLLQLDLVEVSIVTVPANDEARIDQVKAKLAHGAMPTLKEFEGILREAGFSKTQAAVIANRGLRHLLQQSESAGVDDGEGLAGALSGFSLTNLLTGEGS